MELMFITLAGIVLGLAARYALPRRILHGSVLIPAIGGIAAAVVWVALTWAGLAWDAGLIWVITLVLAAATVVVVDLVLGRRREQHDEQTLQGMLSGRIPVTAQV